MKLELLTLEMFESSYRDHFEMVKNKVDYLEFLKQSQKLYIDFSDELFRLCSNPTANENKIIHTINNQVDTSSLYFWTIIKSLEKNKVELKNLPLVEAEYVFNEIVKPNIEFVAIELSRDTAEIANFLSDEIFTFSQIQNSNSNNVSPDQETDKIAINGNVQLWGFIFNELINKGYITAPKHNGKVSYAKFARQLLQHFEFSSQPSENYLTKALKENKYSNNKQEIFKIPNIKIAND